MAIPLIDRLVQSSPSPIVVVSPHLDDAAFSVSAVLLDRRLAHRVVVATTLTQPGSWQSAEWTRVSGFKDVYHEFETRRREDESAMQSIGLHFVHADLTPTTTSVDAVKQVLGQCRALVDTAHAVTSAVTAHPSPPPWVFLPAGAGVQTAVWRAQRLMYKAWTRPLGVPVHPEHELVRDVGLHAARSLGWRWILYAEHPYLWREPRFHLRLRLERLTGARLTRDSTRVDVEAKVALARRYGSQFKLVFGETEPVQVRNLRRDEDYYTLL